MNELEFRIVAVDAGASKTIKTIGDAIDNTIRKFGDFGGQVNGYIVPAFKKMEMQQAKIEVQQRKFAGGALDITDAVGVAIERYGQFGGQFSDVLSGDLTPALKKLEAQETAVARRMDMAKKAAGRMKYEFLGVMFAGMALAGTMSSLMQPSLDAAGVFDVWGATLQILFLPIALAILDVMLLLLNIVGGLPEPVKTAIGVFGLLALILGTVLGTIGTVVLAVMAIGMAFSTVTATTSAWAAGMAVIGSTVAGIIAFVLSPIGLLLAAIAFLYLAWANNWNGMRGIVDNIINAIVGIIGNAISLVLLIFDSFFKLITGDWEGLWKNLGLMFDVFWNGILGNIAALGANILRAFFAVGKSIVDGIVQGITGIGTVIWDAILGVVPEPGKSILKGVGNFVGGVGDFIGGVTSGIGDFIGGVFSGGPHFAEGGFTGNYSGLATVHPNEFIIPENKMDQFAPNTTLNVYTTGGVDANSLYSQWSNLMRQDLRGRTLT